MKRFEISMSTAALGAALVASGPALAFGGGHGGGGGLGGGHMGGGFGGGGFHGRGGFGGDHLGSFGGGGFHNGGGFRGSHFGGFGGGPMSPGRSVVTRGPNRGFGFNRGFDHRFANFNHFHRFHHFRNRFASIPFFAGGLDYDYPYADCGYLGYSGNPYCGYGYSNYAYSYPDYGYDTSYYGNGYANGYDYPATGSSGYYSAAPFVTGRSVATGQLGSSCTISVKACTLQHPSNGGGSCSCRASGGQAQGLVTR